MHRLAGDFVKYHALKPTGIATNQLLKVPGNGFSLAIKVRREIDLVSVLGKLAKLFDRFFLARHNAVVSGPAFVRVNTHTTNKLGSIALLFIGGFLGRRHGPGFGRFFGSILVVSGWGTLKIPDVPYTRAYNIVFAKIFVNCLGFCR